MINIFQCISILFPVYRKIWIFPGTYSIVFAWNLIWAHFLFTPPWTLRLYGCMCRLYPQIAWNSIILDLSCRELNYCLEDDPKKKKYKDFVFLGYPNTSLTKTILRLYCCIIAMPLTIWYIPLLMLLCKSVQKALF